MNKNKKYEIDRIIYVDNLLKLIGLILLIAIPLYTLGNLIILLYPM